MEEQKLSNTKVTEVVKPKETPEQKKELKVLAAKKPGLTIEGLPDQIRLNFSKMDQYLKNVGITPERLISIAMNTLRNPDLTKCTPISLMGALMQSGQFGLLPNVFGESWIIPYWNNTLKVYEAVFQIGYKGLVKLIYRTAPIDFLDANEVCQNDVFDYELGERPYLKHKPALSNRGDVTHFYAIIRLKGDQFSKVRVLEKADVDQVRKFLSKASEGKAWTNFYNEMGKKTALVRLVKYYPLGEEVMNALDADNSITEYEQDRPLQIKAKAFEDKTREPEVIIDATAALEAALIIEREGTDAHERPDQTKANGGK